MLGTIRQWMKRYALGSNKRQVTVKWVRKNGRSWLSRQFKTDVIRPEPSVYSEKIEEIAEATNRLGPQPLWDGYANNNVGGATRLPDVVRTAAVMGNLYSDLVRKRQPEVVVEFGTAFGVSGMYFLAGIEATQKGHLLTFEPNEHWRSLAVRNLSQISSRFNSVAGTFEDNIDRVLLPLQRIDLAFIDAIHTRKFVVPQLEIVLTRSNPDAIIILDDINFSDDMRACWDELSRDSRFLASATLDERVGILELDRPPKN